MLGLRRIGTLEEAHDENVVYVLVDFMTRLARANRLRVGGKHAAVRYIVGSSKVRMDWVVETPGVHLSGLREQLVGVEYTYTY